MASKKTTKKAGLQNQGQTCYLNSLLQSLFYTPEFKKNLFSIREEDMKDEHKEMSSDESIPFEILKLFSEMQKQVNTQLSTKALTKSFGWEANEVYEQHDINDLYNILLDGLNSAMPENHKFISMFYRGKTDNVTLCEGCESSSSKKEHFIQLNISIVCGIFNESIFTHKNLLSAMKAEFFKKEKLIENNQYYCDECKEKCDGLRMIRISILPVILVINLNRYTYVHNNRYKLSDAIKCPFELDLSSFVQHDSVEMDPNIITSYDLSSIIAHSGGSSSGHYVSYNRNWENTANIEWNECNDNTITMKTVKDIVKLFTSTTITPYMVVYRRKFMDDSKVAMIPKFMEEYIKNK